MRRDAPRIIPHDRSPAGTLSDMTRQHGTRAQVVFMRGVNVGGHKTFRPAALAKSLAKLDVVNVGAAGTFVVRQPIREADLRAEFLRRLPFEPELMICRARDVIGLTLNDAFTGRAAARDDVTRFVSVLGRRARRLPVLPMSHPTNGQWQVKVVAMTGRFVLSLWRRLDRLLAYPNEVVQKHFGVPATTRNWNTIEAIRTVIVSEE